MSGGGSKTIKTRSFRFTNEERDALVKIIECQLTDFEFETIKMRCNKTTVREAKKEVWGKVLDIWVALFPNHADKVNTEALYNLYHNAQKMPGFEGGRISAISNLTGLELTQHQQNIAATAVAYIKQEQEKQQSTMAATAMVAAAGGFPSSLSSSITTPIAASAAHVPNGSIASAHHESVNGDHDHRDGGILVVKEEYLGDHVETVLTTFNDDGSESRQPHQQQIPPPPQPAVVDRQEIIAVVDGNDSARILNDGESVPPVLAAPAPVVANLDNHCPQPQQVEQQQQPQQPSSQSSLAEARPFALRQTMLRQHYRSPIVPLLQATPPPPPPPVIRPPSTNWNKHSTKRFVIRSRKAQPPSDQTDAASNNGTSATNSVAQNHSPENDAKAKVELDILVLKRKQLEQQLELIELKKKRVQRELDLLDNCREFSFTI